MIYQLKSPNASFPHLGWPFVDSRTGFKCNGYEGTPAMHAVKIIAHRRANPQHYSRDEAKWFDQASVVQEIYEQKSKTHPHLFQGFPDAHIVPQVEQVVNSHAAPMATCSCGAKDNFEPIYCRTCSGKKILGWKCKSCQKELSR